MSDVDALRAFNDLLDPTIEQDLRTLVETHQGIRYLAVDMQPAIHRRYTVNGFNTLDKNWEVYLIIATMYNLEILYLPEPLLKPYEPHTVEQLLAERRGSPEEVNPSSVEGLQIEHYIRRRLCDAIRKIQKDIDKRKGGYRLPTAFFLDPTQWKKMFGDTFHGPQHRGHVPRWSPEESRYKWEQSCCDDCDFNYYDDDIRTPPYNYGDSESEDSRDSTGSDSDDDDQEVHWSEDDRSDQEDESSSDGYLSTTYSQPEDVKDNFWKRDDLKAKNQTARRRGGRG
jgi:hypothetical protein